MSERRQQRQRETTRGGDDELSAIEEELDQDRSALRWQRVLVWVVAALFIANVVGILLLLFPQGQQITGAKTTGPLVASAFALVVFGGLVIPTYLSSQQRVAELSTRQRIVRRLEPRAKGLEPGAPPSYFDRLVQINLENLAAYYSLVKAQTDKSFHLSWIAGLIGFVLILAGLAAGFAGAVATEIGYISAGAGVITEFIAGIFFYLYNQTVRQLKGYHDRLLAVQNVLLSFKIVEGITDEAKKAELMGQVIGYLLAGSSGDGGAGSTG